MRKLVVASIFIFFSLFVSSGGYCWVMAGGEIRGNNTFSVGATGNWEVRGYVTGYWNDQVSITVTLPNMQVVVPQIERVYDENYFPNYYYRGYVSQQLNEPGSFAVTAQICSVPLPWICYETQLEISVTGSGGYTFPSFSIKSSGSLSGKAPHTVVLAADAEDLFEIIKQYDPDFSYEWDFGDGSNKVTGKRVVGHTYKVAGTYTVTLDVWDKYSNHSQHTVQVVVSQPEDLTVRHFKVYYSNPYQRVPLKVILRPVLEYMPGLERVVSNQWSVGLTPVAQNKSQVVLAFDSAGDYQVNFSGTTNYGRSVLGQFALTVNPNQLPSCTMEYQDYPSQGYTKFTPSCVDPDGKVVSYYWEFGNGEVSKSRVGYAHYSQGGSYGVKLTVKDNSGESRTFSWNVSVTR